MSAIAKSVQYRARRVTDAWTMLPAWLSVSGMGALPVNSFLLKGSEPMLVDTGLSVLGDAYMESLEAEVDPTDLRWVWVSHTDPDHIGNQGRVLERSPHAKIVATFLGVGKLELAGLDVSRVRVLEPGEAFEAGGHRLVPLRPPYYDAPETIGFFDEKEQLLFTGDSFGALLPEPVEEADSLGDDTLREGLIGWSSIDAPWLASVDRGAFGRTLEAVKEIEPDVLVSGHLPVARQGVGALADIVADTYVHSTTARSDPLSLEHFAATLGKTHSAANNEI